MRSLINHITNRDRLKDYEKKLEELMVLQEEYDTKLDHLMKQTQFLTTKVDTIIRPQAVKKTGRKPQK